MLQIGSDSFVLSGRNSPAAAEEQIQQTAAEIGDSMDVVLLLQMTEYGLYRRLLLLLKGRVGTLGQEFQDGDPVAAAVKGNVEIFPSFLDFLIGDFAYHHTVKEVIAQNADSLLQQYFILALRFYFPFYLNEGLGHFLGIHRLQQVIFYSQPCGGFYIFKIGIAAEYDEFGRKVPSLAFLHEFNTVHDRHFNIRDDDIRGMLFQVFQGEGTVWENSAYLHLIIFPGKKLYQPVPDQRLIIYNYYINHLPILLCI